MFAGTTSAKKHSSKQKLDVRLEHVKGVVEHLSLYVGLAIYTAVGAKVFQLLEQSSELQRMEDNLALLVGSRRMFMDIVTNMTDGDHVGTLDTALLHYETDVAQAALAGVDVVSREFTVTWDYLQSVFFASTILTTIGYGNIAPVTMSGRIFCLLFAIIGIPFTLSVVADVGGIFASLVSKLWTAYGARAKAMFERYKRLRKSNAEEEEDEEDEDWISGHLVTAFLALLLLSLFLSLGAGIFLLFEDWTFLDSFYFCFITMTTIGFGDLTPDLGHNSSSYMLLCTVYIFIGMSLTSTIIELVRRQYAESWRKMVELRAQIQAQLKMAATLKKIAEHAESHNLELDFDLAGDLATLKKNLAKMRKGRLGKRLQDVLIEEFDWIHNDRKVKAVTILMYETSL